jgi:hypothetical protein
MVVPGAGHEQPAARTKRGPTSASPQSFAFESRDAQLKIDSSWSAS